MLSSEVNTSARAIMARCEITAPFGQAGGAAGVENDEPVFRLGRDRRRRAGCCRNRCSYSSPIKIGSRPPPPRSPVGGQFVFGDQRFRRHEINAIGEFALRQPPVQAGGDDTEICRRQFDLEIFRPVARQQGDAVAAHKAAGRQDSQSAVDAIQQFAIADPTFLESMARGFLYRARARNSCRPSEGRLPSWPASS